MTNGINKEIKLKLNAFCPNCKKEKVYKIGFIKNFNIYIKCFNCGRKKNTIKDFFTI